MVLPSPNIVTSKISPAERWLKLYRKIHNLFLSKEFVHIIDYNQMVTEMNLRITTIEQTYNAALAAQAEQIQALTAHASTHTHPVSTNVTASGSNGAGPVNSTGTGTGTAAPASSPAPAVAAPVGSFTPPVIPVVTAMQATDAAWMASGPAIAPLGDGFSKEAITATYTALSDVGL